MNTLIVTEYRINVWKNSYYVKSNLFTIIKRYAASFGKISIISRTESKEITDRDFNITEYVDSVISVDLPRSLLYFNYPVICDAVSRADLVIGRFDSIVSCRAASAAKKMGKPFYAELMADAWDGYWNHGLIGKVLAPYMFFETKRAVKKAKYALYVTEKYLQKRYPCPGKSINASNVKIDSVLEESLKHRIDKIKGE